MILPLLLNVEAQQQRRKRCGAERLLTAAHHLVKLVPLRARQ
jgi:hypothetical protein